jgi:hypothetical protein
MTAFSITGGLRDLDLRRIDEISTFEIASHLASNDRIRLFCLSSSDCWVEVRARPTYNFI